MALHWVRLDANIASHDKILHLLGDPSAKKWQAVASYMFALGWSGGQDQDGKVPAAALPFVHGTPVTARLLVKYGLWQEIPTGYLIHNFEQRQELAVVREMKRTAQRIGGAKGNCIKYHGPDCHCWKDTVGGLG